MTPRTILIIKRHSCCWLSPSWFCQQWINKSTWPNVNKTWRLMTWGYTSYFPAGNKPTTVDISPLEILGTAWNWRLKLSIVGSRRPIKCGSQWWRSIQYEIEINVDFISSLSHLSHSHNYSIGTDVKDCIYEPTTQDCDVWYISQQLDISPSTCPVATLSCFSQSGPIGQRRRMPNQGQAICFGWWVLTFYWYDFLWTRWLTWT